MADLDAASHNLQTRLEEATAIHEELQKELSRLGENVGTLVKDKESLQRALDDAKARLITLQALQAAAEARDAAIKSLAQKLTPLVETKRIEMATHDGQTVLVIPGRCFSNQTAQKSNVPAKSCWKHLRMSSRRREIGGFAFAAYSVPGRCGTPPATSACRSAREPRGGSSGRTSAWRRRRCRWLDTWRRLLRLPPSRPMAKPAIESRSS